MSNKNNNLPYNPWGSGKQMYLVGLDPVLNKIVLELKFDQSLGYKLVNIKRDIDFDCLTQQISDFEANEMMLAAIVQYDGCSLMPSLIWHIVALSENDPLPLGMKRWRKRIPPLKSATNTQQGPFKARSASDRTDDWPLWYVTGSDGRTNMMTCNPPGPTFISRYCAEALADEWNKADETMQTVSRRYPYINIPQ